MKTAHPSFPKSRRVQYQPGPSQKLIQERAREAELFSSAVSSGMRTLEMGGMEKVLMGVTDLKQVRSVCIK